MISSKAGQAMYPELARQERSAEARRQAELKSKPITQPSWGKSNDPMWAEPRPAPNGLDRVPGLRRIK